jgi:5-methylcytosine-specific restriction endonuclease McrA
MSKRSRRKTEASTKQSKPWNIKAFAIASLRRASYRWPPREQARREARIGRNQYQCATCKKVFSRKDTKIDHIEPVIPITGWRGFDSFIERLFCERPGFQLLCTFCHKLKTLNENAQRKQLRKN